MKKFLFSMLAMASLLSMGSCSSNDGPENPDEPGEITVSDGVFVVNNGNWSANIPGALCYLNYTNNSMTPDAFYDVNGMYVGDTFQDGIVYGDKIYLAVTGSAVVHVLDRNTLKLINTIQPNPNAGPRCLTAANGKIYATLFGAPGYLCEIDTVSFQYRSVEVGPQPEHVVLFKEKLYVAVSDGYGDYSQSCVAVVNPSSLQVEKKINVGINPVNLLTNGSELYVCSWGEYDSNWNQINYGIRQIVNDVATEIIAPGIYTAINGDNLYYIDAAYGSATVSYNVMNTKTNTSSTWLPASNGVDSPNGMGVDPVSGNVFILSYSMGEAGYPSYNTPGYMNEYTSTGVFVNKHTVGVGPVAVFFNITHN